MLEILDSGFVQVTVKDSGGKEFACSVDLFDFTTQVYDLVRDMRKAEAGDLFYYDGLRQILNRLGFPPLSCGAMVQLVERMHAMRAEFKKKHETSAGPGSPASTGSTPGG